MMNRKGNEMTEKEFKMYGMTEADIREEFLEGITARLSGTEMVVAGILSDIQEMLQYGCEREEIRKLLNVAKFCLFENMEKREAK
jgi:hypothetical protein